MCGTHVIADLFQIPDSSFANIALNDYADFHAAISNFLSANGMTIVSHTIKVFPGLPGAFTALYLLAESHLSFHAWPENNYIAVDAFTCGSCDPNKLVDDIATYLQSENVKKIIISRGIVDGKNSPKTPSVANPFNHSSSMDISVNRS